MNQKVAEYIASKEKERKKEKEEFLIQEGLYEEVCLNNDERFKSYGEYDYSKYVKKVAIEVTDEEFEKIKAAYESTKKEKEEVNEVVVYSNRIAGAMRMIGRFSFVAGVIAATICFSNKLIGIGFGVLVVAFIEGMLLLGFGEVIDLLEDIKNK